MPVVSSTTSTYIVCSVCRINKFCGPRVATPELVLVLFFARRRQANAVSRPFIERLRVRVGKICCSTTGGDPTLVALTADCCGCTPRYFNVKLLDQNIADWKLKFSIKRYTRQNQLRTYQIYTWYLVYSSIYTYVWRHQMVHQDMHPKYVRVCIMSYHDQAGAYM